MTPENELRSKLWEVRYGQRAKETMEIDHYIRPNFQKYLKYIIWLLSQDVELTEEERKIQKKLRNMLYKNVELYDEEEPT